MWHMMLDIEAVAFDRCVDGGASGGRRVAVRTTVSPCVG